MFAIVDIETTGGYASANAITEIAIAIYDGTGVIDFFETLINPQMPIPPYIQSLTGISPAMVSQAPCFDEVAPKIFNLLNGNIFVAHNVNFDYSFVNHHLLRHGFNLDSKKLCTVRLARKILPGFKSYSLGNLCRSLDINISNRHRAGGDVLATVQLFEQILQADVHGEIKAMIKAKAKDQFLPPNLSIEKIAQLPNEPGVYYFHNQKGKVVYVGKAKSLSKRVNSHFSNNKTGRQKQDFLREIHNVSYQLCGSELMAFILESVEIKRLWPLYNRSQKGFEQAYALYCFEDGKGYKRLAIEKKKKHLAPLYTFNLLLEGHNMLKKLVVEFELCPRLCFIDTSAGESLPQAIGLSPQSYNQRIAAALQHLETALPSFAVIENVTIMQKEKQGIILMENGRFYGMGYSLPSHTIKTMSDIKAEVTPYPENGYIRGLIYQYAQKYPYRTINFKK